jgi:predicted secreted protein
MKPRSTLQAALRFLPASLVVLAGHAAAQMPASAQPPSVTVTAAASTTVPNDRLQAWLRAEAEDASAATAASRTNATIARALAEAKAYPTVKVATAGYSTQQIAEPGKPTRWHVVQSISLDSGDFTQAAALMSRLQDQDGLLLSGMGFSISERARHEAEDAVTEQALKGWQTRAQAAAQGLGFATWRVGHVVVQTNDGGRPYPMMRAQAMAAPGGGAPVNVEGGTTEVTVTVSGDAVLGEPRKP